MVFWNVVWLCWSVFGLMLSGTDVQIRYGQLQLPPKSRDLDDEFAIPVCGIAAH
jgi:hypothetical protein